MVGIGVIIAGVAKSRNNVGLGLFQIRGKKHVTTERAQGAQSISTKEKDKKLNGAGLCFSLFYPLFLSVLSVSSVVKNRPRFGTHPSLRRAGLGSQFALHLTAIHLKTNRAEIILEN
jgi:hypothetical protein